MNSQERCEKYREMDRMLRPMMSNDGNVALKLREQIAATVFPLFVAKSLEFPVMDEEGQAREAVIRTLRWVDVLIEGLAK